MTGFRPVVAARRVHLSPAEQMVLLARSARSRGLTFEQWWAEAVRPDLPAILTSHSMKGKHVPDDCVLWPSDGPEKKEWRNATLEAKDGWRRAYERMEPLTRERALLRLWTAIGSVLAGIPECDEEPADGRAIAA